MKQIVNIYDILRVNEQLSAHELPIKLRMSDACGGQTLRLEGFIQAPQEVKDTAHELVISYFKRRGMILKFDTLGSTFWVVQPQ